MMNVMPIVVIFVLGLFLSGCGSSGVNIRTYAEDRPRVDQEISGVDNQGYVGGSMKSGDIAQRKTTRKVYVMEVSKGAGNIKPLLEEGTSDLAAAGREVTLTGPVRYTVEKDDTLQKIARKFYGSYNKWPRIYEANKALIPNPDILRPGTVLEIPMD